MPLVEFSSRPNSGIRIRLRDRWIRGRFTGFGILPFPSLLRYQASNILTNGRPDNCDGSYEQYCDSSREYSDVSGILKSQGRDELLSYMNKYWLDYKGDNEELWKHEFDKHG